MGKRVGGGWGWEVARARGDAGWCLVGSLGGSLVQEPPGTLLGPAQSSAPPASLAPLASPTSSLEPAWSPCLQAVKVRTGREGPGVGETPALRSGQRPRPSPLSLPCLLAVSRWRRAKPSFEPPAAHQEQALARMNGPLKLPGVDPEQQEGSVVETRILDRVRAKEGPRCCLHEVPESSRPPSSPACPCAGQ